jgi:hypothetical protein
LGMSDFWSEFSYRNEIEADILEEMSE